MYEKSLYRESRDDQNSYFHYFILIWYVICPQKVSEQTIQYFYKLISIIDTLAIASG